MGAISALLGHARPHDIIVALESESGNRQAQDFLKEPSLVWQADTASPFESFPPEEPGPSTLGASPQPPPSPPHPPLADENRRLQQVRPVLAL